MTTCWNVARMIGLNGDIMIEVGKYQRLVIVKNVEFGVYLAPEESDDPDDKVLLPKKQVPPYSKLGDEIEVFVYRDSRDRMIATTNKPAITLHEVSRLKVAQVGKYGAFMEWGLEKDLMLPFAEQTRKVREGEEVLCALYTDKSGRLCATMNVYPYLSKESPYHKEDKVKGVVYETSPDFGAFVAVDDKYSALIPKKELYGNGKMSIGDEVEARVIGVKEDGKLDLSIREKSYIQMEADAKRLMDIINEFDGVLPFTDKASPEVIKRETGMSKNEFKKAVGNLYKNRKIEITETAIRVVNK